MEQAAQRWRVAISVASSPKNTGVNTVFENVNGFPEDWKTNVPAFAKFVREHQCPSFVE